MCESQPERSRPRTATTPRSWLFAAYPCEFKYQERVPPPTRHDEAPKACIHQDLRPLSQLAGFASRTVTLGLSSATDTVNRPPTNPSQIINAQTLLYSNAQFQLVRDPASASSVVWFLEASIARTMRTFPTSTQIRCLMPRRKGTGVWIFVPIPTARTVFNDDARSFQSRNLLLFGFFYFRHSHLHDLQIKLQSRSSGPRKGTSLAKLSRC